MYTIDKIRSLGLYAEEKDGHYEVREFGDFVFNKFKKEYQKVSGRSETGLKISGGGTLLWCNAVPASETEYVMQLKAKADELGLTEAKPHVIVPAFHTGNDPIVEDIEYWTYLSACDRLFTAQVGGICVYDKGTWATINPILRAKVTNITPTTIHFELNQQRTIDVPEFTNHIEECIEAYFNGKND